MLEVKTYINNLIQQNSQSIEEWFVEQYRYLTPPFYSSVDLRHSGYKLAPVDTNLFPSGFNNLTKSAFDYAKIIVAKFFAKYYPNMNNVVIIAENHTRNEAYFNNLITLKDLLVALGKNVAIGGVQNNILAADFEINNLIVKDDLLQTINGFIPDIIINNNDLTAGIPEYFRQIKQPIIPHYKFGWYNRKKSHHFSVYQQVVTDFSQTFGLDSFFITTRFTDSTSLNFKNKLNIDILANNVEILLAQIKNDYQQYNIKDEPYVFIKANQGTYGMGIMTASSGEEVYNMNKATRNKMNIIKNGLLNTGVIIQEGVKTIDKIKEVVAEPLVYLMGGEVIHNFYRVNNLKNNISNLNSTGMYFITAEHDSAKQLKSNELVARLASLAAAKEDYH